MKKRIVYTVLFLILIMIIGYFCKDNAIVTDFYHKNMEPSFAYPFGTDWMGRNLFFRTLRGLSISLFIGIIASTFSALIALFFGVLSVFGGKKIDTVITWWIDLMMGLPHLLLLIVLSMVVGRELKGVIFSIALTHWTSFARLIRSELLQLKEKHYIQIAKKLGKGNRYIFQKHMLPHLLPQFIVGWILLFPHAILHESSMTFLGFGLNSNQPAIGILLSESMQYLVTGRWWPAVFPGLFLVIIVLLLYCLGKDLQKYISQK